MAERIELLIADDRAVVRAGLRTILESQPDLKVVGEATTGAESVELTTRIHPKVILMSLRMPEINGVAATAQIKAIHPDAYILLVATQDDGADIVKAIEAGVTGYLLEDAPPEELFEAIRAAARGESLLAPAVTARLREQIEGLAKGALDSSEVEGQMLWDRDISDERSVRQEQAATLPPTGTITFLFTDIEGSTSMWEKYPQQMQHALVRHDEILRSSIEANRGYVFKTVGDAYCAAFTTARDAFQAALAAQRALFRERWNENATVRVRMALHTGVAEERDGDYFGPPVNRVARLLSAGHGGQVLLSGVTYGLARDSLEPGMELRFLGEHHLKDLRYTERIFQLVAPGLPEDFPPLNTFDTRADEPLSSLRHNLPHPHSSFVGREREILEVKQLLRVTSLLTLTGAAGGGKSRLALEVARNLIGTYPDGVWLVELAGLTDPMLVPQAIARALKVQEQPDCPLADTLVEALRDKRMLLVLDNCEHLIDTCARLVDMILASCPHVQILATSREALDVAGETTWQVPSLSLPEVGHLPSIEDLMRYEAIRLFVERAHSKLPTFELGPENARAVVEICRRLDGIPLAIELAAARVTALTVEQIANRLNDSLGLLTTGSRTATPHHQTMRATLKWSYDLLSEQERKLFNRLSVFTGGWTLEAAEAVGAGGEVREEEVLDLLSKLVDKSLVMAEAGAEGAVRYRMLEPIRQYGREQLQESEEAEAVLGRYASLFLALAEQAAPELKGAHQVLWRKRLDAEQDNLRVAMAWLLGEGKLEEATRIGWALWWFWWIRGHFSEGRKWMEEALAKGETMAASYRAKASFVAGTMAGGQADYSSAEPLLEESLSLFRELGDRLGAAHALGSAGIVAVDQKKYERGISLLQEAENLYLELEETWGAAVMLDSLARAWLNQGDDRHAKQLAERGLALSREAGDRQESSHALYILAMIAQAEGNHEQARELFTEGLELTAEVGDETNVAYYLEGLASLAASENKIVHAAQLWGAAEALFERIEAATYLYVPERSLYHNQVDAARTQLGKEAFEAAWAAGRSMPLEQAINYALAAGE